MEKPFVIKRLKLAYDYLNQLSEEGYKIIDLNMIEPFNIEDKEYHPSNIVIERNQKMYAIRSDWTRSLLNYQNRTPRPQKRFGYFGPIIRNFNTIYQAGVELYDVNENDVIESILLHISFIQNKNRKNIRTFIINDEKLLDSFIDKYDLDSSIKQIVFEKDISAIKDKLGDKHPLYELMRTPVSQQFELINQILGNNKHFQFIHSLQKAVEDFDLDFILDLSFTSPQSYYNGLYFQAFLEENSSVLSGGEYDHNAFGIAVNLSDGGLL